MRALRKVLTAALVLSLRLPVWGDAERGTPDYSEMMASNLMLPGLGFRLLGNEVEARKHYAALPISLGGAGLVMAGVLRSSGAVHLDAQFRDGETYLLSYDEELDPWSQVMMYSGVVLGLYGNLLAVYSSYGVHRDYVDRYGDPFHRESVKSGRPELRDVIAAPFRTTNVFAPDVLPILALSTVAGFSLDDYRMMGEYFSRDSVHFMGFTISPEAGLALRVASSMLFVAANAAWEEIAYRGLSLETNGTVYSSVSFGLAHLPNMLVPGVSVENTLLQTLFATAFGFYTADRVVASGYDFSHMVALHFWHNALSLILGYLADPDEDQGFSIWFRL